MNLMRRMHHGLVLGVTVMAFMGTSHAATLAPGHAQMLGWVDFSTGHIKLDNQALDELRAKSNKVAVIGSFGVHFSGTSATLNAVAQTDHKARLTGFPVARSIGEESVPQIWIRRTSLHTNSKSEIWLLTCEGCGGGPSWTKATTMEKWTTATKEGRPNLADLQARLFHVMRSVSSHLFICGSLNDMTVEILRMLLRRSSHITVKTAADEGTGELPELGTQRLIAAKDDGVTWAVPLSELTDDEAQERFVELAEEEVGVEGRLPTVTTHAVPPATLREENYNDLSKTTFEKLVKDGGQSYVDAIGRLRTTLQKAHTVGGTGTGSYAATLISVIVNQTNYNALDLPPLPRLEQLLFSTLIQDTVESSLLVVNGMLNRTVDGDKDTILLISGSGSMKQIEDRRREHNGKLQRGSDKTAPAAQSEFTLIEGRLRTFVSKHWETAFVGFKGAALEQEAQSAHQGLLNKFDGALQEWKDKYVKQSQDYVTDVGAELIKNSQSDFALLEFPCAPSHRDQEIAALKEKSADRIAELRKWWPNKAPAERIAQTIDIEESKLRKDIGTEEANYAKRATGVLAQAAQTSQQVAEKVFNKGCHIGGSPHFPAQLEKNCAEAESQALEKFQTEVKGALRPALTKACVGDKEWMFGEREIVKVQSALRASLKGSAEETRSKNDAMITSACRASVEKHVEEFQTNSRSLVSQCSGQKVPTDEALDDFVANGAKQAIEALQKRWGDWVGTAHMQCMASLRDQMQKAGEAVKTQCEEKMFGATGVAQWKFGIVQNAKQELPNCGSCPFHSYFVRSLLSGTMTANPPPVPKTYAKRCVDRTVDALMQKDLFRDASPYEPLTYAGIAIFTAIVALGIFFAVKPGA